MQKLTNLTDIDQKIYRPTLRVRVDFDGKKVAQKSAAEMSNEAGSVSAFIEGLPGNPEVIAIQTAELNGTTAVKNRKNFYYQPSASGFSGGGGGGFQSAGGMQGGGGGLMGPQDMAELFYLRQDVARLNAANSSITTDYKNTTAEKERLKEQNWELQKKLDKIETENNKPSGWDRAVEFLKSDSGKEMIQSAPQLAGLFMPKPGGGGAMPPMLEGANNALPEELMEFINDNGEEGVALLNEFAQLYSRDGFSDQYYQLKIQYQGL